MKTVRQRFEFVSRRNFIKRTTSALAAMAVPNLIVGCSSKSPNSQMTVGVIGTGNQGTADMKWMMQDPRVQVVAVCDVNRESAGYSKDILAGRDPAKAIVEKWYAKRNRSGNYKGCDTYEDFRDVLARKDIDAVIIATPDHWHAIPVIEACKAGKDIYCQKPLSLTIEEGRAMSNAVKKFDRVFQTGSQQRSDKTFRRACELVRNGRIGKLQRVKIGQPGGAKDLGHTGDRKAPEPIPEGFNYDFWLGPAPFAPYCPARTHANFRWNLDYSGGQLTDWGGHHPDIAQWAMGTEHTGPVEIRNPKGVFPPRSEVWNTATEYSFECIYANGVKMIISDKNKRGITFEGTEGSIWVSREGFESNPKSIWDSEFSWTDSRLYESNDHYANFVDCVYSRSPTVAPCESAHRSITIAHLGNIAMLLGRDLKWDPKKEHILDDTEANKMLSRPYRAPWKLG
jgi:predicted dehydrogenase